MDNIAITIDDVYKGFKVFYDRGQSFKERILFRNRNRYEMRPVLSGISFQIKKGEAVGLVGHNGCGKSTVLKLMTRIIYPDKGSIQMKGKIASLIELGAGFHPDMTGRENIYINASIFGLTRKEIDARINAIISFSELDEFINNPVRTYSSGMYMRLAFAVAVNVDADIMLVDEILAVGDASFQAKCFKKLQDIKAAGTTIVIVSHALGQIEQICDRSIWIHNGVVQMAGVPRDVHPIYLDAIMSSEMDFAHAAIDHHEAKQVEVLSHSHESTEEATTNSSALKELGTREVEIVSVSIDSNKGPVHKFQTGQTIAILIDYKRNNKNIKDTVAGIRIYRSDGMDCYGTNTFIDNIQNLPLSDEGTIKLVLEQFNFLQGDYSVDIALHHDSGLTYHYISNVLQITVYNTLDEVGIARIPHKWCY